MCLNIEQAYRIGIEMSVHDAEENIKQYLSEAFNKLLSHPDLENMLPGLLDQEEAIDSVLSKIKFIATKIR